MKESCKAIVAQGGHPLQTELEDRLRFETFISNISARFVKLPPEEVDREIELALQKVMNLFNANRCGLIKVSPERKLSLITHASYAPDLQPLPQGLNLYNMFPWHYRKIIERKQPIILDTIDDMPPEADQDMRSYASLGFKSLMSVPVFCGQRSTYLLACLTTRGERTWPKEYAQRFQLLAEIFANALTRKESDLALGRNEKLLENQLEFERALSDLSARFIALPAERVDDAIEAAQRTIVETLGLDRSVLYQQAGSDGRFVVTHAWGRSELPPLPDFKMWDKFPWCYKKLVSSGEPFWFSRVEELPREAARDVKSCSEYGSKSSAGFPLIAGKHIFGIVTFTSVIKERHWTEIVLSRLRLVAEIFSNALARKLAEEQLQDRLHEIERLKDQLEKDNICLREEVKSLTLEYGEIVGSSEAMRRVLAEAGQVAPTESTVLILGETGTGKDLLARAIHAMSKRKDRPLVTVNCASLPPSLIESELFGREKGAYTGALTKMVGRFETAEGSTLFLDEIGELPFEVQSKLLRVLETGTFERLGSAKTIRLNVRVIAATNRDLSREVHEGNFRKDLYYRLNVFPITIPPLRERPEDIPSLVTAFVHQFEKKMGKHVESISQKSIESLMRYPWPGNIRELKNIVERAMIVSDKVLKVYPSASKSREDAEQHTLADMERGHILGVLESTGWRIAGKNGAADILGLKRTTLNARLKALGISRPNPK